MTWEDVSVLDRFRVLFVTNRDAYREAETRRKRSLRMRDFLAAWNARHWSERVAGDRASRLRRSNAAR
jgi:hypothetical protein